MRVGVFVGRFAGPTRLGPSLARLARQAEAAGASSLWVNDHFWQIPMFGERRDPVPESYTTLGFLAGSTTTIQLGTLTTGATYRHPAVLLAAVATLHRLSNGRAWLGIGPPWNEEEQRGLGIPVRSWPERFDALADVLRTARRHWPDAGRPPILVGGAHERRVLRLVAEFGDACNLFEDGGPKLMRLKLDMLRRNCDVTGRSFEDIVRTSFGTIRLTRRPEPGGQTVADAVARFTALAELGIDHAIVSPADAGDPAGYELLADVIAEVAPVGRVLVGQRPQSAD